MKFSRIENFKILSSASLSMQLLHRNILTSIKILTFFFKPMVVDAEVSQFLKYCHTNCITSARILQLTVLVVRSLSQAKKRAA